MVIFGCGKYMNIIIKSILTIAIIAFLFVSGCAEERNTIDNTNNIIENNSFINETVEIEESFENAEVMKVDVYNYLYDFEVDYDKRFDMYYQNAEDGWVYAIVDIYIKNIGGESVVIDLNQFSIEVDGIEYNNLIPYYTDTIDYGNMPVRYNSSTEVKLLYYTMYPNDINSTSLNYYGKYNDEFRYCKYY